MRATIAGAGAQIRSISFIRAAGWTANGLETAMRLSVGAASDYRCNQLLLWLGIIAGVLGVAGIAVAVILALRRRDPARRIVRRRSSVNG
jgi:hypothetical protein